MRRRPPASPRSAAALLNKRAELLAEYKARYWRERKRLGAEEALRVVDALFQQVKRLYPEWSIPEDREADLQMHILISAALARTAPSRTRTHNKPAGGAAHRAGSGRQRRLRKAR
jgi:hypothetical protein